MSVRKMRKQGGPVAFQTVGNSILKVDGRDKLTGKACYAGDVSFPNMLYVNVRRSDRPHARIMKLHTAQAESYPGVVAIYTHKDIPGKNRVGSRIKDQPVLCDDKVRQAGDAVLMVVAETSEAAREAANLLEIEYQDLPGIFSPESAMAPDAVRIHESGNVVLERCLTKGDSAWALEQADVIITNTYRTQMVEHGYLEPEAAVARFEDGKMTLWMPSKHAHFDQKEIARVLGMPPEKVRIILSVIGGSFGDKQCLSPGYYTALASLKTGRPCKMVYSREESFVASTKRHPFSIEFTTGATNDGRLVAAKVNILADTGAYASQGPSVIVRAIMHAAGPYEIPHVSVCAKLVYTNNPVCGAMRGFGVPQMAFAHESQMDLLAETLKIDPFELRLKNGLKPGAVTVTGQRLGVSVGLSETIAKVRAEIHKRGNPAPIGSKRFGWGIASMYYGIGLTGLPNPGYGIIRVNAAGDFTLYLGCGDVGQGSATVMAQIAAEVLKCRVEQIKLIIGDTDLCPDSGTSTASRVTYIVGRSVQIAAENLLSLLKKTAAEQIEISPDDLSFDKGFFYPPEAPHLKVSITEAVQILERQGIAPTGEGKFDPQTTAVDIQTGQGAPYATYAFATQGALVSVDLDSGEVTLLELLAAHDIGKAVHPVNVAGQIEGGVVMGIGYGLMEEIDLQKGVIQNPNFGEYFLPTALDLPKVTPLLVESEEPSGPFGAKGVGEPALVPTAPATVNAISAATGIHIKEIPVTPEKLWRLLQQSRG